MQGDWQKGFWACGYEAPVPQMEKGWRSHPPLGTEVRTVPEAPCKWGRAAFPSCFYVLRWLDCYLLESCVTFFYQTELLGLLSLCALIEHSTLT